MLTRYVDLRTAHDGRRLQDEEVWLLLRKLRPLHPASPVQPDRSV